MVAARVLVTNTLDQVMFWWTDGETIGVGTVVGDPVTRQFSASGPETAAGSPEDEAVKEAKSSPEGQAVIAYAERNC